MLTPPFLGMARVAYLKKKVKENTSRSLTIEGLFYCPKVKSGVYVNQNVCNECEFYNKDLEKCEAKARAKKSKPIRRKRAR